MLVKVIAEYHRGRMTCLLEQVNAEIGKEYRVTFRRYTKSPRVAQTDLLTFIPPSEQQAIIAQIEKTLKS